jgi:hypothetical protein
MSTGRTPVAGGKGETRAGETGMLGVPPPVRHLRWELVLAWLLRLLATVWLLKGLSSWATILGIAQLAGPAFEGGSVMFQASTIFFAIIDLIAAVGLWLTATWGGVVWLIAMGSHAMLGYFFARAVPFDQAVAIFYALTAVAYFALNWAAARETH